MSSTEYNLYNCSKHTYTDHDIGPDNKVLHTTWNLAFVVRGTLCFGQTLPHELPCGCTQSYGHRFVASITMNDSGHCTLDSEHSLKALNRVQLFHGARRICDTNGKPLTIPALTNWLQRYKN